MPGRLALVLCLLAAPPRVEAALSRRSTGSVGQILAAPSSRWQSEDVKLLGTAGDIRFVVVAPKVAKSDDELRKAAHLVCGDTPICGVRFWVAESHAARRLPMTDDQARNQIAAYTINKNTGVDDFTCQPTADRTPPCTPAN